MGYQRSVGAVYLLSTLYQTEKSRVRVWAGLAEGLDGRRTRTTDAPGRA